MIYLFSFFFSFFLNASAPTPVMFNDLQEELDITKGEPWTKPNYKNQDEALGYEAGAFAVPRGMEDRVSFWLDIYTKYSTDQGVLHDSKYVHLVYGDIDFSDIMKNDSLSRAQKQKKRQERVKHEKKNIRERLKRLSKLTSPAGLEGDDLRFWYMMAKIDEPYKFHKASKDGRLRFQLGQRDRFIKGIYYSGRYLERMEKIFRERKMPVELTRLPFVESSFNFAARSRVGASGIWQFMRFTAKQYLTMNSSVDDRNDPLKATVAAAKKLRGNYRMLKNWPLAVTGYNRGPSGVRRLVRKFKTDNIVELIDVRKGRFGFASASFYASFLAALEAEKNAKKYFGKVYREKPLDFKKIRLTRNITKQELLTWFDGSKKEADKYNPHLRNYVWRGLRPIRKRSDIYVPTAKYETVMNYLSSKTKAVFRSNGKSKYIIGRGDTLGEIAESFGVSLKKLKDINDIKNPRRIRVGQELIIPQ